MVTLSPPILRKDTATVRSAVAATRWSLTSTRVTVVLLIGAVLLAAALRLAMIGAWPIFMDEDSYITTSLTVQSLSLSDALMTMTQMTYKPPATPALHALLVRAGIDPLSAGRGLIAVAGIISTALTFELGRRLGGRAVGLVAALCYAVSPFAVINERIINMDPWMSACALAATLASLTAIERKSAAIALVAATLGAVAVLFKPPAIAVATVPVVALFLFRDGTQRPLVPAAIAMFGPILCYFALMQSPLGRILSEQNAMLMAPFAAFGQNLTDLADTIWTYMPRGLILVAVAGFALATRTNLRLALLSALMIGVWIAPWIVLSKFAPSRYDLAAVPFLCAFVAVGLVRLPLLVRRESARQIAFVVATGFIIASASSSLHLVTNHEQAAMMRLDDWQFRTGWPAGYGYSEAAALVRTTAQPGSSIAYVVDKYHVAGADMYRPLPEGVTSLGWFEPEQALPKTTGPLYVLVDDGRDQELVNIGENNVNRLHRVMAQRPDLRTIGRFVRPNTDAGVTVLLAP